MGKLCEVFGDQQLSELTFDTILDFLNQLTDGCKAQTKRIRYGHLTAFFNFIKNNIISDFISPCDSKMLRKLFRPKICFHWDILEKETVDEIIFRTTNARDRLLLELMARGGMRVGEVLKLTPRDVQDRKLIIRDPKSGKEQEVIFIPQKVADRLKEYIRAKRINSGERIFPICYEAARAIVKKAGKIVDIHLRPHDLRRYAATYASRSGVPLEIVSKVILRHRNLSTTQIYLGKVSDTEAIRWIENLYA
ncbi:MAG: site-specific integrase [Desulfobacterales bacterium]|jgi:integrase|nr:MAG: site-specific integrase [Desulfobacterales bacterium]